MFGESDWLSWAILSAIFAALTAILSKLGLNGIDSDYATLLRTWVIALVLSVFVLSSNKWQNPLRLNWMSVVFLVLSGLATGVSWVCYFRALKIGEASKVAPVDKLSIVLVAIFAAWILGERPSVREWLGIAMVIAGVFVLGIKR